MLQVILGDQFIIGDARALEGALSGEGFGVERNEVLFQASLVDIDASVVQLGFLYKNPALSITALPPRYYLIYFTVKPVLFVVLMLCFLPLVPHFLGQD